MSTDIQQYTKAKIAKIKNAKEAAYVKRMADAAEKFYAAQDNFQAAQKAKEYSMRSARRAGEILLEIPRQPGTRTDTSSHDDTRYQQVLDDSGIGHATADRWQQIARVSEDKFETYFVEAEYKNWEYSIASLMRFAGEWYQRSDITEWETPQWLFDLLDNEFHFTLDVCASSENAKCSNYYTIEDDGLNQDWEGTCWMNPPYGRDIKDWMSKAIQSVKDGAIVVCLIPARTDTEWWWDSCIDAEIRFIKGRLIFENANMNAPFPNAVVIMRPKKKPKVVWWDVQRTIGIR